MRSRSSIGGVMGFLRVMGCMVTVVVLAGCGVPSFLVTPVSSSTKLREEVVEEGKGLWPEKVVIIEVEGLIINARSGGFLQTKENAVSLFVQQMEKAAKDPKVKAVVLRVNSPGGTVAATDVMYETVLKFREKTKKPVVASAQEVAASGGYYVSCAADKIVVQPTSVVGSIGVIFQTFDISGTLGKIGARTEAIKSGPMKDMGSPFKPLTGPERAVMQGMVDEFYGRFKGVVKARRGLEDGRVESVSDGRVFSGEQAVRLGLADQAGMLTDAIEMAKEMGKASDAEVVLYKRPYGYGGSIYAKDSGGVPTANVIQLNLEPSRAFLPTGFYYLWEPGQ
ncbi:MAG: signal peptide peptidase SppA [Planctomycetota bacterium]|nr:signal peptide peptidase SppA [Planctomycetota bacterium]